MTRTPDPPLVPSAQDTELALQASRILSARKDADTGLRVQLDDGDVLTLPKAATRLLQDLLTEMGQGHAVALVPLEAEVTTQQAADHLHVSRPFLIRLLEDGKIPFRKVGTHRRIRFRELEAFRRNAEEERAVAMDELAAQSQALEMGY